MGFDLFGEAQKLWNNATDFISEGVATALPEGHAKIDIGDIHVDLSPRDIARSTIKTAGEVLDPVNAVSELADDLVDTVVHAPERLQRAYSSPQNFFEEAYGAKQRTKKTMGDAAVATSILIPAGAIGKTATAAERASAKAGLKAAKEAHLPRASTEVKALKHDKAVANRKKHAINATTRVAKHEARVNYNRIARNQGGKTIVDRFKDRYVSEVEHRLNGERSGAELQGQRFASDLMEEGQRWKRQWNFNQ